MNNNEILNKYIDLIDKGYCCDCNELNCIDNFPQAKITHAIRKLQQENKILKQNAENNDKVVDKVNWENQLLKKENKQLKEKLDKYENPEDMTLFAMWCTEKVKDENQKLQTIANNCKQLKDNWNKLKEYFNERIEVCDNRLSRPFCNFEKATKEKLIFSQCLEKLEELEGSDINDSN